MKGYTLDEDPKLVQGINGNMVLFKRHFTSHVTRLYGDRMSSWFRGK